MVAEATSVRPARGLLRGIRIVAGRELGACFDSSIAWVYAAVFLLLAHGIFMNDFFLGGRLEMDEYFRALPLLLVLFVPAITMRGWAEERAQGTFELLATLPFRTVELVLGKYAAALAFYLVVLLGSLPIVVMLCWLGEPDLGRIAAAYVGAVLLGALFLAVGLWASSLTREQVVAFVLAAFACALLVLLGHERVVEVLDGLAPAWQPGSWLAASCSALPRYEAFCRGWVGFVDAAFFAVLAGVFLWLNARQVARRPE
jgi:ABC-2 type transport system permease protein